MMATKGMVEQSLRVLQNLCPEADFDLEWGNGGVKLVMQGQSINVSQQGTKTEVQQYIRMVIAGIETERRVVKTYLRELAERDRVGSTHIRSK